MGLKYKDSDGVEREALDVGTDQTIAGNITFTGETEFQDFVLNQGGTRYQITVDGSGNIVVTQL